MAEAFSFTTEKYTLKKYKIRKGKRIKNQENLKSIHTFELTNIAYLIIINKETKEHTNKNSDSSVYTKLTACVEGQPKGVLSMFTQQQKYLMFSQSHRRRCSISDK